MDKIDELLGNVEVKKERFDEAMLFADYVVNDKPKCPHCESTKIEISEVGFCQFLNESGLPEGEITNEEADKHLQPSAESLDVTFLCNNCNEEIHACYSLFFMNYVTKNKKRYNIQVSIVEDDPNLLPEERWEARSGSIRDEEYIEEPNEEYNGQRNLTLKQRALLYCDMIDELIGEIPNLQENETARKIHANLMMFPEFWEAGYREVDRGGNDNDSKMEN